jgi:hypothetical protein
MRAAGVDDDARLRREERSRSPVAAQMRARQLGSSITSLFGLRAGPARLGSCGCLPCAEPGNPRQFRSCTRFQQGAPHTQRPAHATPHHERRPRAIAARQTAASSSLAALRPLSASAGAAAAAAAPRAAPAPQPQRACPSRSPSPAPRSSRRRSSPRRPPRRSRSAPSASSWRRGPASWSTRCAAPPHRRPRAAAAQAPRPRPAPRLAPARRRTGPGAARTRSGTRRTLWRTARTT